MANYYTLHIHILIFHVSRSNKLHTPYPSNKVLMFGGAFNVVILSRLYGLLHNGVTHNDRLIVTDMCRYKADQLLSQE